MVGVEPHVLRYWEGEFKLRPQRSPSGQRMYRRKDLAKFLQIKSLLHDQGFTIAGARKALAEGLPVATGRTGEVSDERVAEALERLRALKKRLSDTRARLAKTGLAGS